MPDGARAMAVFSSEAALHARNAEAVPVRRAGAAVLADLLGDDYGGLVLDPAGPVHQVLLSSWVRDGLEGRL